MMTPSLIARMQTDLGAALPRWNLSSQSTISFLSHSENTTFLARDPASGRRLVLRVQRIGYHTSAEIRSELAWIDSLIAEDAVVTPRPVADGEARPLSQIVLNGSPRQIAAFEFLSGKEPDPSEDLVAWFGKLGAISARLHAHSRRWKRPPDFQRKVWDFDAMLGTRPLWGDWRAGLGLRDDGLKLLERVADTLKQRLDSYGSTNDRFGLVHADLRLANLLVDGPRLGVIDFDDCGFSWFFYDFAAAVSFMEHEPVVAELQASWLAGYREIAPVSRGDELMLPVFVMLRRMLLTAWIASHSDTETARQLGSAYTDGTVAMGERFLQAL
ncbi:phosphotransferase [Bradyrhizobium sp. CNPSo 4019]|uniref:Phosphotransferase n=2 Tax=Bradyrhizobium diversitatis TaxID=2755406 RepID=A0ABS0NV26_9BRAD|nr:phosphotransferase [Bradyrhizobium diversitatis]